MSRSHPILLIVPLLGLISCASPDHVAASPQKTGFILDLTTEDSHNYQGTHPDGPYEASDPFGPDFNQLERIPPANKSQ